MRLLRGILLLQHMRYLLHPGQHIQSSDNKLGSVPDKQLQHQWVCYQHLFYLDYYRSDDLNLQCGDLLH